jgi:hypothetical protein
MKVIEVRKIEIMVKASKAKRAARDREKELGVQGFSTALLRGNQKREEE